MDHQDDDVFIGAEIDGRRGSKSPQPADGAQPREPEQPGDGQNRLRPAQTSASVAGA